MTYIATTSCAFLLICAAVLMVVSITTVKSINFETSEKQALTTPRQNTASVISVTHAVPQEDSTIQTETNSQTDSTTTKTKTDNTKVISTKDTRLVKKTSVTSPKIIPKPNFEIFIRTLREKIFNKTNEFRIANNLSPLSLDNYLTSHATKYSGQMLTQNFIAHIDKNGCDLRCRFKQNKYVAQNMGENLARLQFDDEQTTEYVANYFISEWEKSSGHRANLLSTDFIFTGIGVARDAHNIYVTVQFSKPF